MRFSCPAIARQCGRNFGNLQIVKRSFDHHLAGELHSHGPQIKSFDRGLPKAAQAAMEIAAWTAKEQPASRRQYRIAKILMQQRHGIWLDTALESISHDQIVAIAQLSYERPEVRKVIAVIGVADNDVFAARGRDATANCTAIAFGLNRNYSCPGLRRQHL